MEGVSTKQPARMTLPRPPAGSGGFASWSFHCAYWGAYIIFVGLFALRVAPTPGRCYRAPPLRLPLIPDNFGGRIYRRTIILCFFSSARTIVPLSNQILDTGHGARQRLLHRDSSSFFSIESRERERGREIPSRVFFARLSVPATIKQGEGEGREVSHGSLTRLDRGSWEHNLWQPPRIAACTKPPLYLDFISVKTSPRT